jgi:hypothetical protein
MNYSNEFLKGWGEGELLCGGGSLSKHTVGSRKELRRMISITGAKSILELGCGDLVWHGPELPDIDYHGIDLHERDTWAKRREQGAKLSVLPANSPNLPRAELIIARLVFIHLNNEYILEVLEEIKKFGKWLFANHDPNTDADRKGRDQKSVPGHRAGSVFSSHNYPVNLNKPPFSLKYHEKQKPPKADGMSLFTL